jgi:predicted aspartyl protease
MTLAHNGTKPLLVLLLTLLLAACSDEQADSQATQTRVVESTTTAEEVPTVSTTKEKEEEARPAVRLRIVSGPGGVFAFARVFIRGDGPFTFTVDTGASHSVVDYDLVRKLGLHTIGEPLTVTGITCRGQAGRLRMGKWRVGSVSLPAAEIQTIDMPDPGGGVDGLLGSDVLSTFGAITVDYRDERLLLGSAA